MPDPYTIQVRTEGLPEASQGFSELGKQVAATTKAIDSASLDPSALKQTAQAAGDTAENLRDVAQAAGQAASKVDALANAADDVGDAMSGAWGQRGKQDLGIFVDYAKQAGTATEQTVPSISKLGEVLNQVGGKGAAANDILEGFGNTLKGNERSALGAAKGIGSLIALLGTSTATLGLSAIALGAAALVSWVTKSKEAKAASEALAKTIAEIAKEVAQLNNTPQDKLATSIKETNLALDEQLRKIQQIAEIEDHRAKAQYELEKSDLDRERRTREAAGEPMSEREYAARQNQIETSEENRLAGRPVELAKQQANAAGQAAARADETAAKTFDQTAQKMAEIDFAGASKLQAVYDDYTNAIGAASHAAASRLASEQYGRVDTAAILKEKDARKKAADAQAELARFGIDAAGEQKNVLEQIAQEASKRRQLFEEQVNLQKAADDAANEARAKAAEFQERATTEQAKFEATEKARKQTQANASDQRTYDATKTDKAANEDRKKGQKDLAEKQRVLAERAQRSMEAGDFADQDAANAEARALQAEYDKKFPTAPATKAPSRKPTARSEWEQGDDGTWRQKSQQPAADKAPAASQPGQSSDLAQPLNDAAQKMGDSATQSADSIKAAADAAAKVGEAAKPIDAAPLTSALQASASAQAAANSATSASLQQLVTLAQQQATLAQQLQTDLSKTRSQVASLSQRLSQIAQSLAA